MNLMKVINKPIKKLENDEAGEAAKKLDKGSVAVTQANQILQARSGDGKKIETKPTIVAGKGVVAGTK